MPKNATGLDLPPTLDQRAFLRKRFKTKISLLKHAFFWSCEPSFPSILAFCRFMSLHFGLLWLHLLSCRLFVALSSSALAFCAFICFHVGFLWLISPFILAFCGFVCFHVGFLWFHLLFIFGLLWLYFLSFFAFCGFISFHFWFLRLHPLSFCAFCGFIFSF